MAGTRIGIQVGSAHSAKSQAIRPAQRRQRKVQYNLIANGRLEINRPIEDDQFRLETLGFDKDRIMILSVDPDGNFTRLRYEGEDLVPSP